MNNKHISIILIVLLFCTSCATKSLWEATDPNEYVRIKFTDITEQELIDNGSKYYKDDEKLSYYVNKNSFEKLSGYAFRTIGTPVTVVVDAVSFVLIGIGVGIVSSFVEDNTVDPESDPHGPAEVIN